MDKDGSCAGMIAGNLGFVFGTYNVGRGACSCSVLFYVISSYEVIKERGINKCQLCQIVQWKQCSRIQHLKLDKQVHMIKIVTITFILNNI